MFARLAVGVLALALSVGLTGCGSSDGSPCGEFPPQNESLYTLPYAIGESFVVTQGNCGAFSHRPDSLFRFGYDFGMPIGTPVHAARAGVVEATENRVLNGAGMGFGNFVFIRHDDGTLARYAHLTQGGVLVNVDDVVLQNQPIGLSGDTGFSTGPHLHFDVTAACGLETCITVPINFLNTRDNAEGLMEGEVYLAESF